MLLHCNQISYSTLSWLALVPDRGDVVSIMQSDQALIKYLFQGDLTGRCQMDPRARLGIEDRLKYAPDLKRDVNLSLVYKGTSLTSSAYRWPRISRLEARFFRAIAPSIAS